MHYELYVLYNIQIPFVKVLAAIYFAHLTMLSVLPIQRPLMEDKMLHEALGEEWRELGEEGEIPIAACSLLIV